MGRAKLLKLRNSVLIILAMSGSLLTTQLAGATWTNVYGPVAADNYSSADHVDLLPDGSALVVGNFWGTFLGHVAVDEFDLFVMRVDVDGSVLWSRSWDPYDPNAGVTPYAPSVVMDSGGRSYISAGLGGIWIIDPDGSTVFQGPAGGIPSSEVTSQLVAQANGFASFRRESSGLTEVATVSFHGRDGAVSSTWSSPVGAQISRARSDEAGGILVSFSLDSTLPLGTTDLAIVRLGPDGGEIWSTLLRETAAWRYATISGDRLVFMQVGSSCCRASEMSIDSGELVAADLGDFLPFVVASSPSGSCVVANAATWFLQPGSCGPVEFLGIGRDMAGWAGGLAIEPLGEGRFAAVGRRGDCFGCRPDTRAADSVGIVDLGSSGFQPILATALVGEPDRDNQILDLAADPTTGRVVAVGRSNGTATIVPLAVAGTAVNALIVSDPWGHGFVDVPYTGWQTAPVTWLKASKLTTGCGTVTFCPEQVMPREQLVTFLYRYNSSPAAGAPNPFADVTRGAYFTSAIDWAYNTGVTTGVVADSLFGTGQSVTRAQAVTFLWRDAGKPTPTTPATFNDTLPNQFYTDAVAWAAETKVTTGYGDGRFGPFDPITRAQFAAFLQRYDALNP